MCGVYRSGNLLSCNDYFGYSGNYSFSVGRLKHTATGLVPVAAGQFLPATAVSIFVEFKADLNNSGIPTDGSLVLRRCRCQR